MTKNTKNQSIFWSTLSILSLLPTTAWAANLQDAFKNDNSPLKVAAIGGGIYREGVMLESIAGQIITGIFSFLGIIFVAFTIYGGFLYMNARGNEEQTKKATSIITQALIGLVIILAAYAITYFIFKFFV